MPSPPSHLSRRFDKGGSGPTPNSGDSGPSSQTMPKGRTPPGPVGSILNVPILGSPPVEIIKPQLQPVGLELEIAQNQMDQQGNNDLIASRDDLMGSRMSDYKRVREDFKSRKREKLREWVPDDLDQSIRSLDATLMTIDGAWPQRNRLTAGNVAQLPSSSPQINYPAIANTGMQGIPPSYAPAVPQHYASSSVPVYPSMHPGMQPGIPPSTQSAPLIQHPNVISSYHPAYVHPAAGQSGAAHAGAPVMYPPHLLPHGGLPGHYAPTGVYHPQAAAPQLINRQKNWSPEKHIGEHYPPVPNYDEVHITNNHRAGIPPPPKDGIPVKQPQERGGKTERTKEERSSSPAKRKPEIVLQASVSPEKRTAQQRVAEAKARVAEARQQTANRRAMQDYRLDQASQQIRSNRDDQSTEQQIREETHTALVWNAQPTGGARAAARQARREQEQREQEWHARKVKGEREQREEELMKVKETTKSPAASKLSERISSLKAQTRHMRQRIDNRRRENDILDDSLVHSQLPEIIEENSENVEASAQRSRSPDRNQSQTGMSGSQSPNRNQAANSNAVTKATSKSPSRKASPMRNQDVPVAAESSLLPADNLLVLEQQKEELKKGKSNFSPPTGATGFYEGPPSIQIEPPNAVIESWAGPNHRYRGPVPTYYGQPPAPHTQGIDYDEAGIPHYTQVNPAYHDQQHDPGDFNQIQEFFTTHPGAYNALPGGYNANGYPIPPVPSIEPKVADVISSHLIPVGSQVYDEYPNHYIPPEEEAMAMNTPWDPNSPWIGDTYYKDYVFSKSKESKGVGDSTQGCVIEISPWRNPANNGRKGSKDSKGSEEQKKHEDHSSSELQKSFQNMLAKRKKTMAGDAFAKEKKQRKATGYTGTKLAVSDFQKEKEKFIKGEISVFTAEPTVTSSAASGPITRATSKISVITRDDDELGTTGKLTNSSNAKNALSGNLSRSKSALKREEIEIRKSIPAKKKGPQPSAAFVPSTKEQFAALANAAAERSEATNGNCVDERANPKVRSSVEQNLPSKTKFESRLKASTQNFIEKMRRSKSAKLLEKDVGKKAATAPKKKATERAMSRDTRKQDEALRGGGKYPMRGTTISSPNAGVRKSPRYTKSQRSPSMRKVSPQNVPQKTLKRKKSDIEAEIHRLLQESDATMKESKAVNLLEHLKTQFAALQEKSRHSVDEDHEKHYRSSQLATKTMEKTSFLRHLSPDEDLEIEEVHEFDVQSEGEVAPSFSLEIVRQSESTTRAEERKRVLEASEAIDILPPAQDKADDPKQVIEDVFDLIEAESPEQVKQAVSKETVLVEERVTEHAAEQAAEEHNVDELKLSKSSHYRSGTPDRHYGTPERGDSKRRRTSAFKKSPFHNSTNSPVRMLKSRSPSTSPNRRKKSCESPSLEPPSQNYLGGIIGTRPATKSSRLGKFPIVPPIRVSSHASSDDFSNGDLKKGGIHLDSLSHVPTEGTNASKEVSCSHLLQLPVRSEREDPTEDETNKDPVESKEATSKETAIVSSVVPAITSSTNASKTTTPGQSSIATKTGEIETVSKSSDRSSNVKSYTTSFTFKKTTPETLIAQYEKDKSAKQPSPVDETGETVKLAMLRKVADKFEKLGERATGAAGGDSLPALSEGEVVSTTVTKTLETAGSKDEIISASSKISDLAEGTHANDRNFQHGKEKLQSSGWLSRTIKRLSPAKKMFTRKSKSKQSITSEDNNGTVAEDGNSISDIEESHTDTNAGPTISTSSSQSRTEKEIRNKLNDELDQLEKSLNGYDYGEEMNTSAEANNPSAFLDGHRKFKKNSLSKGKNDASKSNSKHPTSRHSSTHSSAKDDNPLPAVKRDPPPFAFVPGDRAYANSDNSYGERIELVDSEGEVTLKIDSESASFPKLNSKENVSNAQKAADSLRVADSLKTASGIKKSKETVKNAIPGAKDAKTTQPRKKTSAMVKSLEMLHSESIRSLEDILKKSVEANSEFLFDSKNAVDPKPFKARKCAYNKGTPPPRSTRKVNGQKEVVNEMKRQEEIQRRKPAHQPDLSATQKSNVSEFLPPSLYADKVLDSRKKRLDRIDDSDAEELDNLDESKAELDATTHSKNSKSSDPMKDTIDRSMQKNHLNEAKGKINWILDQFSLNKRSKKETLLDDAVRDSEVELIHRYIKGGEMKGIGDTHCVSVTDDPPLPSKSRKRGLSFDSMGSFFSDDEFEKQLSRLEASVIEDDYACRVKHEDDCRTDGESCSFKENRKEKSPNCFAVSIPTATTKQQSKLSENPSEGVATQNLHGTVRDPQTLDTHRSLSSASNMGAAKKKNLLTRCLKQREENRIGDTPVEETEKRVEQTKAHDEDFDRFEDESSISLVEEDVYANYMKNSVSKAYDKAITEKINAADRIRREFPAKPTKIPRPTKKSQDMISKSREKFFDLNDDYFCIRNGKILNRDGQIADMNGSSLKGLRHSSSLKLMPSLQRSASQRAIDKQKSTKGPSNLLNKWDSFLNRSSSSNTLNRSASSKTLSRSASSRVLARTNSASKELRGASEWIKQWKEKGSKEEVYDFKPQINKKSSKVKPRYLQSAEQYVEKKHRILEQEFEEKLLKEEIERREEESVYFQVDTSMLKPETPLASEDERELNFQFRAQPAPKFEQKPFHQVSIRGERAYLRLQENARRKRQAEREIQNNLSLRGNSAVQGDQFRHDTRSVGKRDPFTSGILMK